MNWKTLFFLLAATGGLLCLFLLCSCHNSAAGQNAAANSVSAVPSESAHQTESESPQTTAQQNTPASYSLQTDWISIYNCDGNPLAEIKDADKITQFTESVNPDGWKVCDSNNVLASIPYYFIDLHNGTAFCLDSQLMPDKACAYGSIGSGIIFSSSGDLCRLSDSIGAYEIPAGFLDQVISCAGPEPGLSANIG